MPGNVEIGFSSPQALDEHDNMLGVVISKLEPHRGGPMRGYIAMLAVKKEHRGKGIATKLVRMAIDVMIERDADEVGFHLPFLENAMRDIRALSRRQIALETEVTNTAAMKLYERLGFLRSKRLHRYYLNGNSAFRFVLFVKESAFTSRLGYDENDGDEDQPELPPSA